MKHGNVLGLKRVSQIRAAASAAVLMCSALLLQIDEAAAGPHGTIELQLGDEYNQYSRPKGAPSRRGRAGSGSAWRTGLLYLPNRLLDIVDIFKLDVGIGPAYGGVIRVTRYGQAGYRRVNPFSARLGLRGRRSPAVVENRGEGGFPWNFRNSPKRPVCAAEVGLGADVAVLGGYGGVCFDELADFIAGFFLVDFKEDDLR